MGYKVSAFLEFSLCTDNSHLLVVSYIAMRINQALTLGGGKQVETLS